VRCLFGPQATGQQQQQQQQQHPQPPQSKPRSAQKQGSGTRTSGRGLITCVHTGTHTHTCTHVRIHTHTHAHMHTHRRTHTHTRIHTYTRVHTRAYTHVYKRALTHVTHTSAHTQLVISINGTPSLEFHFSSIFCCLCSYTCANAPDRLQPDVPRWQSHRSRPPGPCTCKTCCVDTPNTENAEPSFPSKKCWCLLTVLSVVQSFHNIHLKQCEAVQASCRSLVGHVCMGVRISAFAPYLCNNSV
jgi:hypothetical protein